MTAGPALGISDFRDDGYVSGRLGRLTAGQLPPLLPCLAGALVTGVLSVTGWVDPSGMSIVGSLLAPVAALLLAGVGSRHPHDGRHDWLVPPLLCGTECLYLLALGLGGGVPPPVVFLLLAAVVARHLDVVLRARLGLRPAPWAAAAALGWDGRMLTVAVLGLAGWLPFAYGSLAGYLWFMLVWEATTSWLATPRTE
ncbi:DUF5941 domain-containing protein [Allonocardiopsis opalescens]|uniref:DUF5941 domain-containing protein n=1 Tax=Allonocardiopsis opalescens TaxID=1144618 RepID=A0A2T0QC61_9ACTN|nr:DUF5941 domain-containing protein [Allonocardiopsis opalescens]PRY01460.1 hypothetical protein CLV72_10142 [Allonocardiopsis opalescens]